LRISKRTGRKYFGELHCDVIPNKSEIKLGLQHLIDERVAFKDNIKKFSLKAI
jgi:hypothetical protein